MRISFRAVGRDHGEENGFSGFRRPFKDIDFAPQFRRVFLVDGKGVERKLARTEVDYLIALVDEQVDLGGVCFGAAPPTDIVRLNTANSQRIFDLPYVIEANLFEGKPLPGALSGVVEQIEPVVLTDRTLIFEEAKVECRVKIGQAIGEILVE